MFQPPPSDAVDCASPSTRAVPLPHRLLQTHIRFRHPISVPVNAMPTQRLRLLDLLRAHARFSQSSSPVLRPTIAASHLHIYLTSHAALSAIRKSVTTCLGGATRSTLTKYSRTVLATRPDPRGVSRRKPCEGEPIQCGCQGRLLIAVSLWIRKRSARI